MTSLNKQFNYNLEALRGFAATSVFIYHLIIYPEFNLGYNFRTNLFPYAPPGHFMVLVFFMLSGYVIGLTNKEGDSFLIFQYIKKRLVRLYPVYLASIVITIIFFKEKVSVIIGNVFFLQNLFCDNLEYNKALWSLNHEILYYILAIPLLFFKWRPLSVLLAFAVFILSISLFLNLFPIFIEAYLVGFSFWLIGFIISKQTVEWQASPNQLISVLVLFLGCDYLNIFGVFISRIPVHHGSGQYLQGIIQLGDFSLLPACIYAICMFTGVAKKWTRYLFYFVYSASLLHLGYLLVSGSFFKTQIFIFPAIFILVSLAIHYWKNVDFKLDFLAWLGSISYAIYVIHTPILYAFEKIPILGGTLFGFFLRLMLIVPLVVVLAYLLEKKLQPLVKSFFFSKSRI